MMHGQKNIKLHMTKLLVALRKFATVPKKAVVVHYNVLCIIPTFVSWD